MENWNGTSSYSVLHNRLHNNFAEILENLFAFVCSVTRLSEISRFKPFRLSDLCSGSRLGGQGWLPDARQTRRHAQAPQRKHSPPRETTRTTQAECCADARVLRASRCPARVSGAVMRSQRGTSAGGACARSCPNARVKHLGESWARGMGGCSGGRTLAVTDRRAQAAQATTDTNMVLRNFAIRLCKQFCKAL